jgi:hypothetical protein
VSLFEQTLGEKPGRFNGDGQQCFDDGKRAAHSAGRDLDLAAGPAAKQIRPFAIAEIRTRMAPARQPPPCSADKLP